MEPQNYDKPELTSVSDNCKYVCSKKNKYENFIRKF